MKNKDKLPRRYRYPKDYDRRARIQAALYDRRMTQRDLAGELAIMVGHHMDAGYLCALIWGTQRSRRWEDRIATVLKMTWDDLFARRSAKGEVA